MIYLFLIKIVNYIYIFTINFIENEPEIVYHPKSYYKSRKIDYSVKLNEILVQDELSNKIIVMEDNNGNYDNETN